MIKLFELGDDFMVDLNKDWISTVSSFRDLIRRDKGSNGDSQGRGKLQARREFTYIYHLEDFRSPYENFLPDERLERAQFESGLTDDQIADPYFQQALTVYKSLIENSSPSLRMLRAVKASLIPLERYFRHFNPIAPDDLKDHITNIKNLPGMQKALKEYEQAVKDEALEEGGLRGQAEKGFKEDPD